MNHCCMRALLVSLLCATPVRADRTTVSLDGAWQVAEGQAADELPTAFPHTAPVPGLTNLATPPFPQVDAFFSREHLANRVRGKLVPDDWLTRYWQGKVFSYTENPGGANSIVGCTMQLEIETPVLSVAAPVVP